MSNSMREPQKNKRKKLEIDVDCMTFQQKENEKGEKATEVMATGEVNGKTLLEETLSKDPFNIKVENHEVIYDETKNQFYFMSAAAKKMIVSGEKALTVVKNQRENGRIKGIKSSNER